MASSFPGSVDSFSTKVNRSDIYDADHINDLQNAMVAAQTAMGGVLIATAAASGDASIDFLSGIDSTYNAYMFTLSDVLPSLDSESLFIRISDDGSTFEEGATDYEYVYHLQLSSSGAAPTAGANSQGDLQIFIAETMSNASGEGLSGIVRFFAPAATTNHSFIWDLAYFDDTATPIFTRSFGTGTHNGSTAPVLGVQFKMSSGNIASGNFALYGLRI